MSTNEPTQHTKQAATTQPSTQFGGDAPQFAQPTHEPGVARRAHRHPTSLTPGDMLYLQRTMGNRAVQQHVTGSTRSYPTATTPAPTTGMVDDLSVAKVPVATRTNQHIKRMQDEDGEGLTNGRGALQTKLVAKQSSSPTIQRQPQISAIRQPVIQRQPEKIAQARGIKLKEQRRLVPSQKPALVMDPAENPGKSMAADPELEAKGLEFERKLGIAAFNHPRANHVAIELCRRIFAYIQERMRHYEKIDEWKDQFASVMKQLAGEKNYAGAVTAFSEQMGESDELLAAIEHVFQSGNLRERLNLVDQFMKLLRNDYTQALKSEEGWQKFQTAVANADLNQGEFARLKSEKAKGLFSEETEVEGLDQKKEKRDDIRVPSNKPSQDTFTRLTRGNLGQTPLSDQEVQHQKSLNPTYGGNYGQSLNFTEGARYFLVDENSAWVQKMRALSLPLKAGPSGHTRVFYEANNLLGANLPVADIRLAAIGHLLPINAHSLIEILEVAKEYGCLYTEGKAIYTDIAPYTIQELRRIAGGIFPHETVEDAQAATLQEDKTDKGAPVKNTQFASTFYEDYRRGGGEVPTKREDDMYPVALRQEKIQEELGQLRKNRPVQSFLKGKEHQAAKEHLEEHVAAPKLTWNSRAALELADDISGQHEAEYRQKVEKKLETLGFDLKTNPDLYDKIVEYLRASPVTLNFKTTLIEQFFRSRFIQNQWERSVHPTSTTKAYYGDGGYAMTRDKTEMVLHGLPELEEIGEAAESINPHVKQQHAERVKGLRDKLEQTKLKELQKEKAQLDQAIEYSVDVLSKIQDTQSLQAKGVRQTFEGQIRRRTELEQDIKRLQKDALKLNVSETQDQLAEAELLQSAQQGGLHPPKRDKKGFRENRSLPIDRPHSAAIGAQHRAGQAVNPTYGISHFVLKESVKERSTVTGGDSLEQTYRKGSGPGRDAVGNFRNMGAALFYASDPTLKTIAEHALHPDMRRKPLPEGRNTQSLPYLEVQVFGAIDMMRDVEKVVIDEAELDAWASGEAAHVFKMGEKLPKRPKAELKKMIEEYAESMGIEVVYIHTGDTDKITQAGAVRGVGKDTTDFTQPFETYTEATLRAFRQKDWAGGIQASLHVIGGGKGSIFGPSYARSGLTVLVELETQLHDLKAKTAKEKLDDAYADIAARLLNAFYKSAMRVEYTDEFERVLSNIISYFREAVLRDIYLPKATDTLLIQTPKDRPGLTKLWTTSTAKQKTKLLELVSLDPNLKGLSDLGYLFEALDEGSLEHYHRRNLQHFALTWARSPSEENFFEWLQKDKQQKVESEKLENVTYFDETEREQRRIAIDGGRLKNAKDDKPLVGDNIFVVSQDNVFFADKKVSGKIQHSTFLAGGPVRAAGHLITDESGTLQRITNESGHYRPTQKETLYAMALLAQQGVDLQNLKLEVDKKEASFAAEEVQQIDTRVKSKSNKSDLSMTKYSQLLKQHASAIRPSKPSSKLPSSQGAKGPSGSLPESSSSQTKDKDKVDDEDDLDEINTSYLYEDNDMYALLNALVTQHLIPNAIVIPPCDNTIGNQLQNSLRQEQVTGLQQARKILIPYNLGNYHWVGIYLDITDQEAQVTVSYMDPLTLSTAVPLNVTQEILAVYANAAISTATRSLQSDSTSCGPVTIKNLVRMAQNVGLPMNERLNALAIYQLRLEHSNLMEISYPEANFSYRQQHNISTISSTFNAYEYLKQNAEATFSPSEYKQLVVTMKNIKQLGAEAQKSIVTAFSYIKKHPEISDFYRLLRKAIYNSVQIVAQGNGNVAERQLMNQILTDIWGVTLDEASREANFDDETRFKFRDFEQIKKIALSLQDDQDTDKLLMEIEAVIKKQEEERAKITTKFAKKETSLH